jgi:hypothetical protein
MLVNKLRPISSAFLLLGFALAPVGCDGFFVDATLTSVSVGPQKLSMSLNEQWQMTATGTYNDGSQKTLTSGVTWSSADPAVVSVGQTSGKVIGLTVGSATISASSGSCSACSGSTLVTVTLQGVSSIAVSPSDQTVQIGGTPVYYRASANGATDITDAGTNWTVVDSTGFDQTSKFTVAFMTGEGEGFLPGSNVNPGTYTVRAAYNSAIGTATLNVQ